MSIALEPYIGAEIPSLTNSLIASIKAQTGQDIPFEVMAAWLSAYVDANKETHFSLSRTRPDFEGIKVQFIARVQQTVPWKDVIQAGWAQTISEFFAAIGDYGQESIMRAYQESGLEARLTSSMYMQMRGLGVHIDRVIPPGVPVLLWGEGFTNQTIPELSTFSVNGADFFNREPIQFNNNVDQPSGLSATLYQGTIVTQTYASRGVPFQYFEVGDSNSNIADEDLYCYTDAGDEYKGVTDGLWHYSETDPVFYHNLTPAGNVEILFGNDVYGKIPPVNAVLYIVYADSLGDQANTSQTGLTITLTAVNEVVPHRIRNTDVASIDDQISFLLANVRGVSTGAVVGGAPLKDREFYRAVGPGIRASGGRMVNRLDHYSQGLRYPGLADILFQGQKELASHDRRFTNVIGVSPLMTSGLPMTAQEWSLFVDYLTSKAIWGRGIEFLRIDPQPVYFDISGDVYMTKNSDTTNVGAYLRYSFNDFFQLQRGSIGKSVYGSDIEDRFKFSYGDMTVDYARNISPNPSVDTILSNLGFTPQYPVLRTFVSNVYSSGRGTQFQPPRELY